MRETLSSLIAAEAEKNPEVVVLSGDHGHDFFKQLRSVAPKQFINCGVIEPALVGIAAGMARDGRIPIVYGLASFIPIKVIEQIKLDFCQAGLRGIFIGDGAGVVYTTMGPSHQCIEDIACLRAVPGVRIYSPHSQATMVQSFDWATTWGTVSYIRIGKSGEAPTDRPYPVNEKTARVCLVSHGGMVGPMRRVAERLGIHGVAVTQINDGLARDRIFDLFIVIEDHGPGGLASVVAEQASKIPLRNARSAVRSIGPRGFSETTGSYEYVLRSHGLDDESLATRVQSLIEDHYG